MKILTFSYDDGTTQDIRLAQLFHKYGMKATFNLNSGLFGRKKELIRCDVLIHWDQVHAADVKHIYEGHEVAAHTLTHPHLTDISDEEIVHQVEDDRLALSELCGYEVVGMAYPGGGVNYNTHVAQVVREQTGIRYARTTVSSFNFEKQENLFEFKPSIHHFPDWEKLFAMGEQFLSLPAEADALFYVWGHGFEFDIRNDWDRFEEFLQMMAGKKDVQYLTNKDALLKKEQKMNKSVAKNLIFDVLYAILSGAIVGTAYYFFQNSNGFAPGGVGGLATITHYLVQNAVPWSVLMITFNLPIFVLVSAFINKKLGLMLSIYMCVQSFIPDLWALLGASPYSFANNGADFNIVFACIATGVVSGFGFSLMLKRFGASGGTYGISALLKKARPEMNLAYVSFIMDAGVVCIAFFVYGRNFTPALCTLLNLFVANVIVDHGLGGMKNGYKFEIITDHPNELAAELMKELKHGVTEIRVHGMYSDTDKHMLICIINKRQIGEMMKLLKRHPNTFASFEKVNEVFGNFKRKV